jgi:hypothetical protein
MPIQSAYYGPGKPGEKIYNEIRRVLADRLAIRGEIRTADAYEICLIKKVRWSYPVITIAFRSVMEAMADEGKARKIKSGRWEIIRGLKPVRGTALTITSVTPEDVAYCPTAMSGDIDPKAWAKIVEGRPPIEIWEPVKKLTPWFSNVYKTMLGE